MVRWLVALLALGSPAHCQLPDNPRPQSSRNFWILAGLNAGATALDAWTTISLVGHSQKCPYEVQNPGLYGRRPGFGRVTLVMGGLWAASAGTAWVLRKKNVRVGKVKLWAAPIVWEMGGHLNGGIRNLVECR